MVVGGSSRLIKTVVVIGENTLAPWLIGGEWMRERFWHRNRIETPEPTAGGSSAAAIEIDIVWTERASERTTAEPGAILKSIK